MNQKFSWPQYPSTEAEFESLMTAVNEKLSGFDLKPHQRPFHVGRLFWQAFGWGGKVMPPSFLADEPGYEGDILMAKAWRWYEQVLGTRLNTSMTLGNVPISIAGTVWKVLIAEWFGSVDFYFDKDLSKKGRSDMQGTSIPSLNVLTMIDQLPQGLVDRTSMQELNNVLSFYVFAMRGLEWRNNLPRTQLLDMARGDYNSSSQNIFDNLYSQARWMSQQAAEKTLKGLLAIGGTKYQTRGKGHDLQGLATLLHKEHGIKIHSAIISAAQCSTNVRYDETSTSAQALVANHAVLGIYDALKNCSNVNKLLLDGKAAGRILPV